jgi:hypothetical protein
MRDVVGRAMGLILAFSAATGCLVEEQPTQPPVETRGLTRPAQVAGGTGGATAGGAATTGPSSGGVGLAEAGAAEEPTPPCTALASCCATFATDDLQGFCQETLVSSSPAQCAIAVQTFGCAPQ